MTNPTQSPEVRAAFEAEARKRGYTKFDRVPVSDCYRDDDLQNSWRLAVAASSAALAAVPASEPMNAEQRKLAAQKTDWCPHCGQGWGCAVREAEYRGRLHAISEIPDQPRNFCATCGKPTPPGSIHTCTPPQAPDQNALALPGLEPPDLTRCQAERPNGQSFMTLGGGHKMVRCANPPTKIATERHTSDGVTGSMAVCDECAFVMVKQLGQNYADFQPITE